MSGAGGQNTDVAVELAGLRGCVETSFARVEGQLGIITERVEQTRSNVGDIDGRVRTLESRRWPLASIGVLSGAVSAVIAAVPFIVR